MRHQQVHQSHYSYWKRTSAIPTSAALITGALLAIGYSPESAAAQFTDEEPYEPYVLVDIGLFLDDPDEDFYVTLGEAMDVNNMGYVVGHYQDDSGDEMPFVFDPADGGSLMTVDIGTFDEAWMNALNTPSTNDFEDIIIVGWAGTVEDPEPVFWEWNSTNSQWEIDTIYSDGREGIAHDVNEDGDITGYFWTRATTRMSFMTMAVRRPGATESATASTTPAGCAAKIPTSTWHSCKPRRTTPMTV